MMGILSIEFNRRPDRAPDDMLTDSDALAYLRQVNIELRIEIEACYQRIDELEREHRKHKDIFEECPT